jgi:hypothetical protein
LPSEGSETLTPLARSRSRNVSAPVKSRPHRRSVRCPPTPLSKCGAGKTARVGAARNSSPVSGASGAACRSPHAYCYPAQVNAKAGRAAHRCPRGGAAVEGRGMKPFIPEASYSRIRSVPPAAIPPLATRNPR